MKKLLIGVLALCLLAGCGGEVVPERQPLVPPAVENETPVPPQPVVPEPPAAQETVDDPTQGGAALPDESQPPQPEQPVQGEGTQPQQPVPPAEPQQPEMTEPDPVPPEEQEITQNELTCTLEIRCDKLIGNAELDPDKVELVPADGLLFSVSDVVFYEGESVFNVLQRTMKQNKQHLEFVQTPLYNSAYIEGICNLYAFDAGALSGWMYSVNGVFPSYGCSQYVLQAGDVIQWHYTCDLGADLGTENVGNNQ